MTSEPLTEFLYLQPLEAQERILLKRGSVEVPPYTSWFYLHLIKTPMPILGTAEDGLPIYYVPAPKAVLLELIRCATHPDMAKRRMTQPPPDMDAATWKEYMEEYCLTTHRLPVWFPTAAQARDVHKAMSFALIHQTDLVASKFAYLLAEMSCEINRPNGSVFARREFVAEIIPDLTAAGFSVGAAAPRSDGISRVKIAWK